MDFKFEHVPLATGVGVECAVRFFFLKLLLLFFKVIWSQRMNQKSNRAPSEALLGLEDFGGSRKKRRKQ